MSRPDAYDPAAYGDAWACAYDPLHQIPDLDSTVRALATLADGGRVLEFGSGTGRLALPLAASGTEVHGVEASEAMIARLREKPGGDALPLTRGDFTEITVEGQFSLVVCAFHTLLSLPTQELQVRCFERAAAHLAPGGRFVVEASVPRPQLFEGVGVEDREDVQSDAQSPGAEHEPQRPMVQRHDPVSQRLESVYLYLGERDQVFLPIKVRYVWPSEMDLMARLAGMDLETRWEDWSGGPFTASSQRHVSVYRTAGDCSDVRPPTG